MSKKLDAILACRVQGARLYAKPLQRLEVGGVTVIEYLFKYLKAIPNIRQIILAISEGAENTPFVDLAKKYNMPFVVGDETDVLGRIIKAAKQEGSEYVFRVTTESPFVLSEYAESVFQKVIQEKYDFATVKDAPEGTAFEIFSTAALFKSHAEGQSKNRSELVSSFVCENPDKFRILMQEISKDLRRPEVRLTVDYAEDLIYCQKVFARLNGKERLLPVSEIIKFWDDFPDIRKQVQEIGIDWGTGRLDWGHV